MLFYSSTVVSTAATSMNLKNYCLWPIPYEKNYRSLCKYNLFTWSTLCVLPATGCIKLLCYHAQIYNYERYFNPNIPIFECRTFIYFQSCLYSKNCLSKFPEMLVWVQCHESINERSLKIFQLRKVPLLNLLNTAYSWLKPTKISILTIWSLVQKAYKANILF